MVNRSADTEWEHVTCNLCGYDTGSIIFATVIENHGLPHKVQLIRCAGCGLVYLSPRPTRQAIRRYYEREYGPHHAPVRLAGISWKLQKAAFRTDASPLLLKLTAVIRWVINTFGTRPLLLGRLGHRLIDVGCATGHHLSLYHQLGWDVQGVESDAACCSRIRGHLQLPVIEGSWEEAEIKPGQAEAVIFWHVLEHLHNPREGLRKGFDALAPSGTVQIAAPTCDGFGFKTFQENWAALELPRHLFFFSRNTLHRILEETGFTQVRVRTLLRESLLVWKRSGDYPQSGTKRQFIRALGAFLRSGGDVLLAEAKKPQ